MAALSVPAAACKCSAVAFQSAVSCRGGGARGVTSHLGSSCRTGKLRPWRLARLTAPSLLRTPANSKADDSFPSEMPLENALKILGVTEGASFEEILRAKNAVLSKHTEDQEMAIQLFLDCTKKGDKGAKDNELWRQCERYVGATMLTGSLLMVALPANAMELPFGLPPDWQGRLAASLILGVLYFFVIPLLLYIYLDRRWAKRKMFEAIIQFWLVFLFFPGMLLLAPFLNFRQFGREGAKEPWDKIRPS